MDLRGRPPLAPLALAACVLASDLTLPAFAACWRIQLRLPNSHASKPSTVKSASSWGQCRPVPKGETSISASSAGRALARPWAKCGGNENDEPLTKSMTICINWGQIPILFSHVATGNTCRRRLIFCQSTALGMFMAMAFMHRSSQPCLFCILSMALLRSLAMVVP